MELDAFSFALGTGQGRLSLSEGEACFVLGEVEPGYFFELAPGDFAEVSQSTDLTGVTLIRSKMQLRVPVDLPDDLAWEVSLTVDGTKFARAFCAPGRSRTITDLAANVSKLKGTHTVGVRLELVKP